MKKIICLLICVLMLLPTFVACDGGSTETSDSDNSQYIQNIFADDEVLKLLNIDLPENREYVNILNSDVDYSFNRAPSKSYADSYNKLVDEYDAESGYPEDWVGFIGRNDIEITVDFGKKIEGLCGFSILTLLDRTNGRGVPLSYELYISDDGSDYKKIITTGLYSLNDATAVNNVSAFTEKGFSARYVKLVMSDFLLSWVFIDAFRIYTCKEATVSLGDYYTNEPYYTVDKESYWPETDKDYNTVQNLVLGKTPWFVEMDPISDDLLTDYYNTPTVGTVLSDGNLGEGDLNSPSFIHVTQGVGRDVIYDLGNLSSVSKFVVSCKNASSAGVTAPESAKISISENGKDWVVVDFANANKFAANGGNLVYTKEFSTPYRARYVKFSLDVGMHLWLAECAVYGTKKVQDNAIKFADVNENDAVKDLPNAYPSVDVLDGSQNIFLSYNYAPWGTGEDGRRDKEQYMHLVGYYNNENKLTDFFFDSFYFLPMVATPSFFSASTAAHKQDFLNYINDVFYKDHNAFALNEAVGEVKEALNKPDYKAFIYFPMFNVSAKQKDFGDVDGDGVTEDCSNFENYKKVSKWYIDTIIKRYSDSELENLKLNGFCLYDEHVEKDADSYARVKFLADYIHSLDYKFIWIPATKTTGSSDWKELGFDCANMQPGYAFGAERTVDRLINVAEAAKYNGLGIEIEGSGMFTSDKQYNSYVDYLAYGALSGYMNSIKAYYPNGIPCIYDQAFESTEAKYRAIYDITYLYAKNKLTVDLDSVGLSVTSFEGKAGETITGKYSLSVPYLTVSVKHGALHGMFTQNRAGEFKYTPDEGYTGYDKVTLTVKLGSLVTKDVTILFNVSE